MTSGEPSNPPVTTLLSEPSRVKLANQGKPDVEKKLEMVTSKLEKFDLKRLSRGAALCGAPVGGAGSVDMLGIPASGEILSLTLALGAFVGVGAWMFRRWGKAPAAPVPTGVAPEAGDPVREREPVNA